MSNAAIAGMGFYVPDQVVTNEKLTEFMDTSDEWIQERTGIKERRYARRHEETTASMGASASRIALDRAGIKAEELDFIIFATISPDYYFPGCGVLLQRELKITGTEIGCLDVRNQCSGFIYGLSIAQQYIKGGTYKNILLVGAENHSMGLDFSTRGRNVSVIFGDGAGAVVLQPSKDDQSGVLTTHLHADGTYAEELAMINPGSHGGYHDKEGIEKYGYNEEAEFGEIFITQRMLDDAMLFPHMNGQLVFKTAIVKFIKVIREAVEATGFKLEDIDLFVPHQANLRISQFVQQKLGLSDDKVWNNIQRYGNTTAGSIPIALAEAWENGKAQPGDLVCLAAFGSGFTWGSVLVRM